MSAIYGGTSDWTLHLPQEAPKGHGFKDRQKERERPRSDWCEAKPCTRKSFGGRWGDTHDQTLTEKHALPQSSDANAPWPARITGIPRSENSTMPANPCGQTTGGLG